MHNVSPLALRIQLEDGAHQRRPLPQNWQRSFGGGRGLAARLLSEVPADVSPLAPQNPLIIAPGLLHGVGAVGAAGVFVSARSPLTGLLAQGWAEGDLGNALQRAGVGLLVIAGAVAEWSTLVIQPDGVRIVSASDLIGCDTVATAAALHTAYGSDARVLALGPAGEKGVAYAAPVVDGRYLVEPAGVGAVMAAKRLKAIVVRGGVQRPVADAEGARRIAHAVHARSEMSKNAAEARRFGSATLINALNDHGAVTPRNGQDRIFPGMLALSRSTLALRGRQSPHGACRLPCHADFVQRDGTTIPRPDLEAMLGFGVRCGIADLEVVLLAHDRCLKLGLDVNAMAAAIAFLAECQQEGLHRSPPVPWGDGDALLDLIEQIGRKEGVGGLLGLGVGEMQSIFWGSDRWAPQVNGGAMSPIDPRPLPIMALHLATSTWPGDYRMALPVSALLGQSPEHVPSFAARSEAEAVVQRLLWHERLAAALDALGVCRRAGLLAYVITPAELASLASAVTGTPWAAADLAKLGERIVTLERIAVTRNGVADRLPSRWADTEGRIPHELGLHCLLPLYYAAHGWDADGLPSSARLQALDLVA